MCVEHRNLMWTLMFLSLSGAVCSGWKVEYQPEHICAVKGSSVTIHCSYSYPGYHRVERAMWGHEKSHIYDGPFIFDSENINTSSRFEYIGDKQHNCSFKIHQVEHNDAGKHAFRFLTDKDSWTGHAGSTLKIVDSKVFVTKSNGNRATEEGDSVNLTCINSCDDGNLPSVLTWFKNGEPLNEGPALYLSNLSFTNSGNYTCALKNNNTTTATSEIIRIDVEYGPKNTSVSVSPSMEVDTDSNIALTCSSRANPPVENYTWFKIDDDDLVDVGHQPVFISGEEGQYLCRATNKHGSQNSSVVTLKINKNGKTFNHYLLIIPTVAVALIVASVIAVRRCKRKRKSAPETDHEENVQEDTDYINWPVYDNNESQDRSQCEAATVEMIYATVDFHTKTKSNMEQRNDSHHGDEGVIYSTVCRSQLGNP